MTRIVIAMVALIVAIPFAQSDESTTVVDRCKSWSEMAEKIMKARQLGAPMSDLMDAAAKEGSDLTQKLIVMAYEQPRFSTEQYQVRAADDFRDEIYLACVKQQ